jgi:hypothetical protein
MWVCMLTQVMYPGIESMFRHDLTTLKRFCALAQPQHLPALDEIERQFLTEFDYRKEADNLRAVRENVLPKWGRRVAIPEPIDHLCTEHVLVMVSASVRVWEWVWLPFRASPPACSCGRRSDWKLRRLHLFSQRSTPHSGLGS